MKNAKIYKNDLIDEKIYYTKLESGLDVYIYKKPGYVKKMGLYGTRYGSIDNNFVDNNGNEIKVPDGIAHFLEHKLFEKEGANALDLFAQMGVSCNAYTSNDHTVYYFETIDKFEKSLETLIDLIKEPYFTDENVEKEKGIISQEIKMYDDDPDFIVYMNLIKAMYKNHPINIDIAGTVESITNIDKEVLYTCYNTFYTDKNMFLIVVGDVDIDTTIEIIKKEMNKHQEKNNEEKIEKSEEKNTEIERFYPKEEKEVNQKEIEEKLDIFLPKMYIGYKQSIVSGMENIKYDTLTSFIDEMYFGKFSKFYDTMYNDGYINQPCEITYESSKTYAYVIIACYSTEILKLRQIVLQYVEQIKSMPIDEELFNIVKRKKIGELIYDSESINSAWSNIIDDNLNGNDMFSELKVLKDITKDDIKDFMNKALNKDIMAISTIKSKE